ncbi:hypothetical protein AADZ91_12715 [Colwelliaceae bacterium 6441]
MNMQKNDIFKVLVENTKKVIGVFDDDIPKITNETYFSNLGASSCDRAEIVSNTLVSISLTAKLEDILIANTIGEMVELIFKKRLST